MASGNDIRISISSALNAAGIEATKSQVDRMTKSVKGSLAEMAKSNRHHWADIKAAWDMGVGIFRSAVGVIQDALRRAFDAEYALTNFKTLLGGMDEAKAHVAELKKFASETPLSFGDISGASKSLLAFGMSVQEVMPSLKMVGDISLGNSEKFESLSSALGQVKAAGHLTGVQLKQMIIAGFNPLVTISQQSGVAVDELKKRMEDGVISYDLVAAAMKSATSEGGMFHDAMKDASKTGAGLFSTMKDNWNAALATLGGAFLDCSKNGMQKVIEKIQELMKDGTLHVWADKISRALEVVAEKSKTVAEWLGKIASAYKWVWDRAEDTGHAIGGFVGTLANGGNLSDAMLGAADSVVVGRREREQDIADEAKREAEIRSKATVEATKKAEAEKTTAAVEEKKKELSIKEMLESETARKTADKAKKFHRELSNEIAAAELEVVKRRQIVEQDSLNTIARQRLKLAEDYAKALKAATDEATKKEIEANNRAAENRLSKMEEFARLNQNFAAQAANKYEQARRNTASAWDMFKSPELYDKQREAEAEERRQEARYQKMFEWMESRHGNGAWREANDLSPIEEIVRRVALAREEEQKAKEDYERLAEYAERSATSLEVIRAAVEEGSE